jgi:ABC-type transport system substrate-binding protein
MFGLGEVVDSPIYIFRPEYDKSLESYPYDPKKAMALLREAGWTDTDGDGVLDKVIDGRKIPFRFEFKIPSGAEVSKSISLVLQDEMKRYGIATSVRELDWTIFLADVKNHQFDVVLMAWGMQASEPDAYQIWHSSQAANKGSNHISYKTRGWTGFSKSTAASLTPKNASRCIASFSASCTKNSRIHFCSRGSMSARSIADFREWRSTPTA